MYDNSEKLVSELTEIGFSKNNAAVLVCLHQYEISTQRDIERKMDLRQPEVSLAIKKLTDKNMISIYDSQSTGKGRPVKIYRLSLPLYKIIENYQDEMEREHLIWKLRIETLIKKCKDS